MDLFECRADGIYFLFVNEAARVACEHFFVYESLDDYFVSLITPIRAKARSFAVIKISP